MKDKTTPEIGHGWFSITQAKEIGASIHISAASNYPVTVSEVSPEKPTKYTDVVSVGKVFVDPIQVDPKYPKPKSKKDYGGWVYKNMVTYNDNNPFDKYYADYLYNEYNNGTIRRRI
jgi:hypothetical protein